MKKIILLNVLLIFSIYTQASKKNIQYGLSVFGGTNYAQLIGGTDLAHANFYQHDYGTGAFNFNARWFINDKWSVQSGIGFTSLGFEYGFAKNYSLIKNDHFINSKASIEVTQIPLMAIYNFKPDCKNKSWVLGAGFNFMFSDKAVNNTIYPNQSKNESIVIPELTSFSHTFNTRKISTANFQLMFGREKKFNKGNRLAVNAVWNIGLAGEIAKSTVSYTIAGNTYEHIFSNNGHYAGISISYLFSNKASRAKADMLKQL